MGPRLSSGESLSGVAAPPTPPLLTCSPGLPDIPPPALPHCLVTQVGPQRQVSWLPKAQLRQLPRSCLSPQSSLLALLRPSCKGHRAQDKLLPRCCPHCASRPTSPSHLRHPSPHVHQGALLETDLHIKGHFCICACMQKGVPPIFSSTLSVSGTVLLCMPIFHPVATLQSRDRGFRRGRSFPGFIGGKNWSYTLHLGRQMALQAQHPELKKPELPGGSLPAPSPAQIPRQGRCS